MEIENEDARGPAAELVRRYFFSKVDWPGAIPETIAAEGQDPATIRARYGPAGLQHYVRWHGWRGGPTGTITDDTQLTQVILMAVNAGYDADTVASIAGNIGGAWCGAERLRRGAAEWRDELEYRDEIIDLADGLAALALRASFENR